MSSRITVTEGVLVSSDEASIVYIKEKLRGRDGTESRLILKAIDARNLLVQATALPLVRRLMAERQKATTFDEDEDDKAKLAAAAAAAAANIQ